MDPTAAAAAVSKTGGGWGEGDEDSGKVVADGYTGAKHDFGHPLYQMH